MKNNIKQIVDRLELFEETLGGSGSPYADKTFNYADDLFALCNYVKTQHFVVELVDDKVLAVHPVADLSEACVLGVKLAAENGFEDNFQVEDCLENEFIFVLGNYSIQIKNNS